MGNRILKESICLNRKIDQLTDFQENMFYRLIVKVDDYGVFLADPAVLASVLYPRKRHLAVKAFSEALKRMEALGLIRCYTCDGESYLQIVSWGKHQRIRTSVHRFPMPEDGDAAQAEPDGKAAQREQAEPAGEAIPLPWEEPEGGEAEGASEKASGPDEARELPVIELPLNDNTAYGVTRAEADEYAALYPAVDIMQALRNMRGWCMANPQKRKTRSGIRKFINAWLSREQDKGGSAAAQRPLPENPFIRMAAGEPDEGWSAATQRPLPENPFIRMAAGESDEADLLPNLFERFASERGNVK